MQRTCRHMSTRRAHVLLQHLHAALRDLAQADQRRVPLPPVRVLCTTQVPVSSAPLSDPT